MTVDRRYPSFACALVLAGALGLACAGEEGATGGPAGGTAPADRFAVLGQLTWVEQESNAFHAPYAGPNSLSADAGRETVDLTLYLGSRLWEGAELWVNTELDQGSGLDDTLGVAGFTSGEAYKVGRNHPYLRLPRLFLRQTWNSGNAREPVEADLNQFVGSRSPDRLVLTVGKFSVGDIFDASQYAHDPRHDFLNWAAIDAASFDYAADAWGYTVGAALEWYGGPWALRAGLFDLSNVPNSVHLEPGLHEFQGILELEHRHELGGQPGRLLLTGFDSRARMALLDAATAVALATGQPADPAPLRELRDRGGAHLTLDQQLASDLGLFARVGAAAGNVEAYDFTDVDRTVALGLSLKGPRWHRAQDTVGAAVMRNVISAARCRFLDAGGLGILVGDGRLPHPGPERIFETYYEAALLPALQLTLDYQRIVNPGYNRDRGPVSVLALRVHAQF